MYVLHHADQPELSQAAEGTADRYQYQSVEGRAETALAAANFIATFAGRLPLHRYRAEQEEVDDDPKGEA